MESSEPARLNEWQRGPYDKRSNPWALFLTIIVLGIFWILFVLNIPNPDAYIQLSVLSMATFLIVIYAGAVVFVRLMRWTVRLEEVKYFDLHPPRVSRAIERLLNGEGVPHTRDGPKGDGRERWEDRFELLGPDYLGHAITVERNPITRRIDLSCVTVQSSRRRIEPMTKLKELIESAITAERLHDEGDLVKPPELVLYAPPP